MTNPDALAGVVARVEALAVELCFAPEDFNLGRKYAEAHAADLRSLLAALAEATKERDQLRDVLQNLADDDGYCDFVSIARDALIRTPQPETPE